MKFRAMFLLLIVPAMFNVGQAEKLNPITRVVELLEGLAKKVYQDGKAEEDLYETYVCWAKTVIKTKTATNDAAKARIEELSAYIADIEAGKVEFTSERADLEASIKVLNEELETADDMRDKESRDYMAAKDEMEKAIAALTQAVEVLKSGTKGGSLLLFQQGEHTGAAKDLQNAIQLGKQFLSKGDELFLQRVLTGEVPKADWKKLNRKSNFKMKYKARSGNIQTILADMLSTFKVNLEDAIKKEKEAAATHKELAEAKHTELTGQQEALESGEKEGSARGVAKDDAKQEVQDLEAQVKADTGFIEQTEEALADQKAQWKERKKLRTLEIASINKAIAILNSDDARDTMKSSMKSSGYLQTMFLQKSAKSAVRQRASAMLREVGTAAQDSRVTSLAMTMLLQKGGPIDDVVAAIDKMITKLKDEEESDLQTKETCEKDREDQTKNAHDESVKIDDFTEGMARNTARIAELKNLIEEKESENIQLNETLIEATRNREDEQMAFETALADDKSAAELIKQASDVLKNFYKDNGLSLIQKAAQPPDNIQAGKAPPPPPQTFDAPYSGSQGESAGIQALLEMVREDVLSDIEKSTKANEKAIEEFEALKVSTREATEANMKAIEDMNGEVATCEKDIEVAKEERHASKGTLDAVMDEIKVAQPACEFMTVNFKTRAKNRQLEMDGLRKAKTILRS